MSIPVIIENKIDEIRNDFTNGSTVIAANSLKVLSQTLNYIDDSHIDTISNVASKLISTKPHMAALTNILRLFLNEFTEFKSKEDIQHYLSKLDSDLNSAREECINNTLNKLFIDANLSIITCSFSSTVYNIIIRAKAKINVYILESVWNGIDFGKIWIDKLKPMNINCSIIKYNEDLPNTDFALLGADAILFSGDVVNGTPSLKLAETMNENNIAFYIASESIKMCSEISIADGFDLIPKKYISEVFTDNIFTGM
ncbi:MAG: hypothetical protein HZB41_13810 [Ignavibacteriae bacterium]|nr:hypothetical protein [Ignavibacteriota bacterium]